MDTDSTTAPDADQALFGGAAWFDPIEAELRERIRGFLEELFEQELTAALGRRRYEWGGAAAAAAGHRHGRRARRLIGSFGPVEVAVPRARLAAADGSTREWRSAVLPRYARRTRQADALSPAPTSPAPTPVGSAARSARCSMAWSGGCGRSAPSRRKMLPALSGVASCRP
jgi:putative transposase